MSAREEILSRVRSALADVPPDECPDDVAVPRDYARTSPLEREAVLAMFVDFVEDYGARVHRATPDGISAAVGAISRELGLRDLVVPSGFPEQWVTGAGVAMRRDEPPIPVGTLDRAGGVITTAAVAIAETGTIVLVAGPGMGRRALSLVPDVHLCVVREDQVVATVPEAMEALAPWRDRPITLISGGSATSDIELVRVEGVHGPRTLEVVLVAQDPAGAQA
jgi:L-lactate dehydrogenase complex protein LldG